MSEFAIGLVGTGALLLLVFAGVRVFVVAALVGPGCVAIIGWKAGAGISGTVLTPNQLTTRSADVHTYRVHCLPRRFDTCLI